MKKLIWAGVVLVLGAAAVFAYQSGWIGKLFVKSGNSLEMYSDDSIGFVMQIPGGWKIEVFDEPEKFLKRTVFSFRENGFRVGNISQLSVTVVANPSATQPFSTDEEFAVWEAKTEQSVAGTGVLKLANEEVDGQKAVRLAEVDMVDENMVESFWSVTTWFIKERKHFYINMMGNGALTDGELQIFSQMLRSFRSPTSY